MFNFFCNLALAIYSGRWYSIPNKNIIIKFLAYTEKIPLFGMFNQSTTAYFFSSTTADSLSTSIESWDYIPDLAYTIATILSIICCIGVFFIIVKAIKKLFTCFLDF